MTGSVRGVPPGRPSIGPMVNVRLSHGTIARLDELADRNDIGRAELIRRLISGALAVAYNDRTAPMARRLLKTLGGGGPVE